MDEVTSTKKSRGGINLTVVTTVVLRFFDRPWKLFVAGFLVIAAGHVMASYGPEHHAIALKELSWAFAGELTGSVMEFVLSWRFFGELLREFGFALWVAAAIAVLFEFNSVLRDSSGVLVNFLRSGLPKDWFDYLVGQLRDQKVHRPTQRVEYVFTLPTPEELRAADRHFLVYSATTNYRIRNLNRFIPLKWPVRVGVERPWDAGLDHLVAIDSVTIDDKPLTAEEIELGLKNQVDTPTSLRLRHEITIPAGEEVAVRMRFRGVMYSRDTTTYTFRDTSDHITMNVRTPEGYVANLTAHHNSSPTAIAGKEIGTREWQIDIPLPCMPPSVFELSVSEANLTRPAVTG